LGRVAVLVVSVLAGEVGEFPAFVLSRLRREGGGGLLNPPLGALLGTGWAEVTAVEGVPSVLVGAVNGASLPSLIVFGLLIVGVVGGVSELLLL
jgi:hypothetical protein